ncbi:MAG: DUF6588 family protein [Bacteroidota bacterium]
MKNILAIILILILGSTVFAQDNGDNLNQTLSNLSSDAVKSYVAPAVSSFGSNLNSGWVSKLPSATKFSLNFDLKFVAMGSFLESAEKNFATSGTFRFTEQQAEEILNNSGYYFPDPRYVVAKEEILSRDWVVNISGPTIVGSENERVKVYFPGDETLGLENYEITIEEVKGLLDNWKIFPSAAVQLTVGTLAGTNVSLRYLPDISKAAGFNDELGKFTFWGLGIIHNPGVWLMNPLPVDIGVGYFYQKLEVGDVFESSNTQFGLYASKTFGFIFSVTPYAGLTFESSTTSVRYDYEYDTAAGPQTAKIDIELEGDNSAAFLLGVSFKLAAVNINADYKMAKTNTASLGLSFGF